MKADISAYTFRPGEHFAAVVAGQGQVLVDSALNEQEQIARHRVEVTTADAVGQTGVPRVGGGFAVSVAPDGQDLLLAPGRAYVDGVLCENGRPWIGATVVSSTVITVDVAAPAGGAFAPGQWVNVRAGASTSQVRIAARAGRDVTVASAPAGMTAAGSRIALQPVTSLRHQPDRFTFDPFAAGDPQRITAGAYRLELDVWNRHISPVEDPSIHEPALGDAESATRLRTVWQLRLVPAGVVGGGSCVPAPPTAPGQLLASTVPGLPSDSPCVLPDEAGYRGLENQLYRVEVHDSTATQVVLKWQRDNASTASRVEALGAALVLADMGRDDERGFATAPFVEITDDALELEQRVSDLIAVSTSDRATRTVNLVAAPAAARIDRGARAVRWDGRIVIDLTAANAAQPVVLERGIQVALVPGALRPGDFWLIAARTANSAGGGTITWPADDGGQPLAQAPLGIEHHISALALVDTDGTAFLTGSGNVRDCRHVFPSLTAIAASDVSVDPAPCGFTGISTVQQAIDTLCRQGTGFCTVTATPGAGWERVFDAIAPGADAEICFPVGVYPTPTPVQITGKGSLLLHGAGPGSRLVATSSETALLFGSCTSVTVESLAVSGGSGATDTGLAGALTFVACPEVTVRDCQLSCATQEVRRASCLRVTGGSLRVRDTRFGVGNQQIGLLAVDTVHTVVTGSDFVVTPLLAGLIVGAADATAREREQARRLLISDLGNAAPTGVRVGVTIGARPMSFATTPAAKAVWPKLLQPSYSSMRQFQKSVDQVLRGIFSGQAVAAAAPLVNFVVDRIIKRRVAVMAQAIVVGGTAVGDVRIEANRIGPAIQGVHVGASGSGQPRSGPPAFAGPVTVSGNRIHVLVPAEGARARHAVFIGNADRLRIVGNDLSCESRAEGDRITTAGIRVYGFIGRAMTIRDNVVDAFPGGIGLHLFMLRGGGQPALARMWAVEDNLVVGASPPVTLTGPLQSQVRFRGNRPGPPDN